MRLPTWTSTESGDLIDMGILLGVRQQPLPVYDANPALSRVPSDRCGREEPSGLRHADGTRLRVLAG